MYDRWEEMVVVGWKGELAVGLDGWKIKELCWWRGIEDEGSSL